MFFRRLLLPILIFCVALFPESRAEAPKLLARALEQWAQGREDLAFTQQTRFFSDDGAVKEERIERYDPSLPDSRRWYLISVDGRAATAEQRAKLETPKNHRARKKVAKTPGDYLDLDHATLAVDTPANARFEIGLRPEAARLLAVEKIAVAITVDKESGAISRIAATLRQPIRVLLGLARITDLDIDVRFEPADDATAENSGEIHPDGTAHVAMSTLGNAVDYSWSDFKRVTSFPGTKASG